MRGVYRYDADADVDANDFLRNPAPGAEPLPEVSTCSPSYGATYGSFLHTMMEDECGSVIA